MDQLNNKEYKLIQEYKRSKNIEIATYFFNKYQPDLTRLIFSKINKKFSSVPFEKGDLFSFIWKGVKLTLETYKKDKQFNQVLIRNCYLTTLKEVKRFITNGHLIMNQSYSLEKYLENVRSVVDKNRVSHINEDINILIKNIVEEACGYVKNYTPSFVKKVIYLKSIGCSISEICKKLNVGRYFVDDVLDSIEEIMRKSYGL